LIHSSGKPLAWPELKYCTDKFISEYHKYYGTNGKFTPQYITDYMDWIKELYKYYHIEGGTSYSQPIDRIKEAVKQYGYALPTQAIIGEAELVDIVKNSKDVFAIQGECHWILNNPVLYKKPILNIMGKLRLWEYY
jgi:hypothetical protein